MYKTEDSTTDKMLEHLILDTSRKTVRCKSLNSHKYLLPKATFTISITFLSINNTFTSKDFFVYRNFKKMYVYTRIIQETMH